MTEIREDAVNHFREQVAEEYKAPRITLIQTTQCADVTKGYTKHSQLQCPF
jgi:hypothetical protein